MISKLMNLALMPNPSQDQATFDERFLQLLTDITLWGAEVNAERDAMNAIAVGLNTIAAGGAYALPYVFDAGTTAADPGSGKLRFNNGTQSLATALYVDVAAGVLGDVSALLASFNQSTSATKGRLRLVKMGDVTKFMTFNVTAAGNSTGYFTLTVNSGAGSSGSPFAASDSIMLFFERNGDQGNQGEPGTLLAPTIHVRDERASGVGGGGLSNGTWVPRTFNTTKLNTISGASLASNRITLPAGTYEFEGSAPAWLAQTHQCRLYNVTDSLAVAQGTSECAPGSGAGAPYPSSRTWISDRIVITASKVFELQHYASSGTYTQAAGQPVSSGGVEVYAEIKFRKVA